MDSDPDEEIFERSFRDPLFDERNPTWYPYKALRLHHSKKLPHTMFVLAHRIPGVEGKLLRGEVLAIVAAIKTRLSLPSLAGHRIIPVSPVIRTSVMTNCEFLNDAIFFTNCALQVLVYSFMSNQYGRILQAVFNGTVVDIWMTSLFDFRTPEAAEPNFQIFLQYMTGRPIGTTTETLSVPVEELYRLSLGG